eukprot:scaffold5.g730.t1
MLRSVLGERGDQGQDANGKLLQLADRAQDGYDGERNREKGGETGEEGQMPSPSGIESVITQVAVAGGEHLPPPAFHYQPGEEQQLDSAALPPGADDAELRSTWKDRFRSIFCCIAPASGEQYQRQAEGPVVIRPPALPLLPAWEEPVIGELLPEDAGKKTLVLDLDETLVHSSFKPVPSPDYIIPVEIEGRIVDVYVLKRPFVDHFLRAVGQRFEVIVFTASLGKYADPLLDLLDKASVVRWRLFREACYPYEGSYVKDLQARGVWGGGGGLPAARLGRPLSLCSVLGWGYVFQPENAIPITTFIDDMQDQELLDCLDMLLAVEKVEDVRAHLGSLLARRAGGSILNSIVSSFGGGGGGARR